jgi:6-phosphofructokinase
MRNAACMKRAGWAGARRELGVREAGGILQRGGAILKAERFPGCAKTVQPAALRQLQAQGIEALLVVGDDRIVRGAPGLDRGLPASFDNDRLRDAACPYQRHAGAGRFTRTLVVVPEGAQLVAGALENSLDSVNRGAAARFGVNAVERLQQGERRVMVGLQLREVLAVLLEEPCARQREPDLDGRRLAGTLAK